MTRRFSSVSSRKVCSRLSRSRSTGLSRLQALDPRAAAIRPVDELAAVISTDVFADDRDAPLGEETEGDLHVLLAEVPRTRAKSLEHAGPAEDLGRKARW